MSQLAVQAFSNLRREQRFFRFAENTQDVLFVSWHVKSRRSVQFQAATAGEHLKPGSSGSTTWPHCFQINHSGRYSIALNLSPRTQYGQRTTSSTILRPFLLLPRPTCLREGLDSFHGYIKPKRKHSSDARTSPPLLSGTIFNSSAVTSESSTA